MNITFSTLRVCGRWQEVFHSFILTPQNTKHRHIFALVLNVYQPHGHELVRNQVGLKGVLKKSSFSIIVICFYKLRVFLSASWESASLLRSVLSFVKGLPWFVIKLFRKSGRMWSGAHLRRSLASTLQWPLTAASWPDQPTCLFFAQTHPSVAVST